MSAYKLVYHPDVFDIDLKVINNNIKQRIKRAIESRLFVDPIRYGAPLRRSLKGYWKLRVGDYRVIYEISKDEIRILNIGHRKEIYHKSIRI